MASKDQVPGSDCGRESRANFQGVKKGYFLFAPGVVGRRTARGSGEFIEPIPDVADRPGTTVSGPDLQY